MDREKVIKAVDICIGHGHCEDCYYCLTKAGYTTMDCRKIMLTDVLVILKEQEAVKPRVTTAEQRCGNCNKVIEMDGWITCPWCGKPILWEAVGRSVKQDA